MAIRSLPSNYGYKNNNNRYSVLNKPVGATYLTGTYQKEEEDEREQNVGGLLGGLGFLGEKVAVGAVSSIEGIVDYLGSGFAKLFGNDQWAEDIIANDWFGDWYSHPEEWYNPDQTMKFAGDVAGGIGTSLPAMGTALLTSGASAGVQFAASFLASGLGAAGRSTKEAYEQSGELTDKEFGYGALSGATEGGLEGLTNLIGFGTGAIVKGLTKSLAKETGEALMKNVAVEGLKSFAGEAFEEGVSEWITPYWKRATYDPKAKEATPDEIIYSAVVGGVSGLVMDGGRFAFDKGASYTSGVKAANKGSELQILEDANEIAEFENKNKTENELFSEIIKRRNKLSESLKATGGKAVRADQQMELGALKRATVAASVEIGVAKRAMNIVNNADTIAQRLTSYGYKRADGTQISYTADQLTAGYDKTRPQSIYKALKTNDTLRSLAIADFTGRLMMDTNKFKQATLTGQRLASQVDLNRFLQQATPEEVAAVSEALGITSWSGLTAEQFNQKITDFLTNGGVQKTLQANELKGAFKAIPAEGAQGVPRIVNLNKDGIRRYTDGKLDIGVERKGDSYTVYDYNADTLSKGLDREGVNSVFRDYAKRNAEVGIQNAESVQETIPQAEPTNNQKYQSLVEDIKKFQSEVREVDSFARKHVKEYAKLSQPSKDMVKNVILQGRKHGISDSDLTMYARVSAHSGIDIQFDKEANYRGVKKDGSADYADGFYEAAKNRIVVNPEGKRTAERLLIHELDHAIRKYFDSEGKPATRIYLDAIEGVDQATRDEITKAYKKTAKPGEAAATIMDETNAYYAEQVLGNKYTLEKLLEAEPTLKDKILSFFKGASTDYADVPKLSSAAKRYYKTYKKLFDEFSARNYENNAISTEKSNYFSNDVSGRDYAFKGVAEDGKSKYEGNFPKGTPKSAKSERILDYITNVWSKKPISLVISNGETSRTITAQFDPTLDPNGNEPTDASKIAGGNRHGSGSEKRVTLDLADDYYQIASEAKYNYSKEESGKDTETHKDVIMWHYFVDDIYFSEYGNEDYSPYTVTVNVKEKPDGTFVYSFNAEKTEESSTRRTLHAGVNTRKGANGELFIDSIPENAEKVNRIYEKIKSEYPEIEKTLTEKQATSLIGRGIEGDSLLDASDLAETIRSVGGEIAEDASVILYHGTTKENADKIISSGKMYGKEDGLFFSTRGDGLVLDYGKSVVRVKIPIEKLLLDDIFDSEVHLRLPVKPKVLTDVVIDKTNASSGKQYALDIDSFYANGEEFATPTLSTVGKERVSYEEKTFSKEWRKTKSESAYIHAVDEMYGIQSYLEKVGKSKNAKATIQTVRSTPHQVQTMIGSVQYNIFKGDAKTAKKMGEGLNEIFRPIEKMGEKATREFNDYLLHQLNVDKYNANEKMKRLQEDAVESFHKVQDEIKAYEKQKENLEKRIFELGNSPAEKKLKEGNKKAIDAIDEKLGKLKADESELLLQMPMHAEAELKVVNDRISELMRNKNKIKQDIFEAGNSEDAMARKKDLREKAREIDDNIAKEKELADKLQEIVRLHDYSLKPVFNLEGTTITKEESERFISKYELTHPEFKKAAEKVWKFSKNLNEMRVDSQLISRSFAQRMAAMYPHYVPSFRSQINNTAVSDEGLSVSSTVKKAKGYNNNIMDVKESIASQVAQVARNGNINLLANKVYDTAANTGDSKYVDIGLPDPEGAEISREGSERPKPHILTFFKNGKEYQMNVSDEIYAGFKGVSEASAPQTNVFARVTNWITNKYKKLVTSMSPAFMIRNAIRDLQDAGLNSKHPLLFAKSLSRAWVELVNNSENWQTYRAYGGFGSTVFDSKGVSKYVDSRGFEILGIKDRIESDKELSLSDIKYLKALFVGVENVNAAVEQIPRFAEYLASIEAGETIEQAIYNSAEVTTNFGRRGATTKQLNSTIIPFLNPAIQGFDKIFRNVSDAAKAGDAKQVTKAMGTLLGKAILIGMLPMLFNSLMYDDDEDYKDLREEDKENNYLIKLPNGTFIKLPRGRVASVIAGLANRTMKMAKGEDADWLGYAENVVSQVTPVENLTRTVFSPFMDVANNRTWYGTEIEGRQFENVRPEDRYDESTSSIAIAIAKVTKFSPKKIHYLIDQYSGVIGDFLLPATTQKAEKDFFSGNFTLDPVTSNKISNQFYKIYDEAQYSKTDGDVKAQYQVKYLNKVKSATSELYKEINAIQSSDLSSVEKLQQTRVLRIMINEAMKNAIADYQQIGAAIDKTASMGFNDADTGEANIRYAEIIRQVYGSERALSEYNGTVYSNMTILNSTGLSYDTLYNYYFGTKGIESDKDAQGNTISGSKRAKVVEAINSLGVSVEQRLLLICASGYSLKDGDIRGVTAEAAKTRLLKYILRIRGLTADERLEIAEMCGFKTKNGKIVNNFSKKLQKISKK